MTTFYVDKENSFISRLFIEWLSCARYYAKLPKYNYDLDKPSWSLSLSEGVEINHG